MCYDKRIKEEKTDNECRGKNTILNGRVKEDIIEKVTSKIDLKWQEYIP